MIYSVINDDASDAMNRMLNDGFLTFDCVFADPPDNLGLDYGHEVNDSISEARYANKLQEWFIYATRLAPVVWWSFNARYTALMGHIVYDFIGRNTAWEFKPCVQTFTFGPQRTKDLKNNHRPLWRLRIPEKSTLYPNDIKVESARQKMGDKRAAPGGCIPGDVFDFPRVVGNSKQRRKWRPTQLNEGLVERAIRLVTKEGDNVLDPFGGTGTTLRVCKRIGRSCTIIEKNSEAARMIASENDLNDPV